MVAETEVETGDLGLHAQPPHTLAVRLYRLLLLGFPKRFRHLAADEMVRCFVAELRLAKSEGGSRAVMKYWTQAIWDATSNGLLERFLYLARAVEKATSSQRSIPDEPGRTSSGDDGGGPFSGLDQDIRVGVRRLWKSPVFSVIALVTLALGIGVNTALFQVANNIAFRPLPYENGERLVRIHVSDMTPGREAGKLSPMLLERWQSASSFESLAVYDLGSFVLMGDGGAELVRGGTASPNFFDFLGVQPTLGRGFRPEEGRPGENRVAVISHGMWTGRFGSDPSLLGEVIIVDEQPLEVVGILGPEFEDPTAGEGGLTEVWRPLAISPESGLYYSTWLNGLGRLSEGVTPEQLDAELAVLWDRLKEDMPDLYTPNMGVWAQSLRESIWGDFVSVLVLGNVATGLVLLIACANLASLVLARAAGKAREFALQAALGASRLRAIRPLLVENLLLALAGGSAGLGLAALTGRWLGGIAAGRLPRVAQAPIDWRVALFAMGIAFLTVLAFGLIPGLRATRISPSEVLKEGGAGVGQGRGGRRLRRGIVVGQLAFSVLLLTGGGLTVRSLTALLRVDQGYRPEGVVSFELRLPSGQYSEANQVLSFESELVDRLAAMPTVLSAGAIDDPPLGTRWGCIDMINVDRDPSGEAPVCLELRSITPGYIEAMDIALLQGRSFTASDGPESGPVAIVNQRLADLFWPGESPLGKRVRSAPDDAPVREVVGVIGDVHHWGPSLEPAPELYLPYGQARDRRMTYVLRTTPEGTAAVIQALPALVDELAPGLPIRGLRTMESAVEDSVSAYNLMTMMFLGLAALALGLSLIGIYGVLAYLIARRFREIGLRIALGAKPEGVRRLVLREGVGLGMLAILIGLPLSILGAMALRSELFGVAPLDLVTLLTVTVTVFGVCVIGSYIPSRRAMRVDPLVALRAE